MKCFYFVVFTLLFYSCTNGKTSVNEKVYVINYDINTKIIDSPYEPIGLLEQQPSLAFGKIEQPFFPDSMKVEQNLITQIDAYKSAFLHGDIMTCSKYIYPDAIKYCKKYYKGLSDEEIFLQFMKDISGNLQGMIDVCANKGIEVEIVNSNLLRKVEYDNDIIIVFNTTVNFCSDYVYTYCKEMTREIGVSHNRGVNWFFFTANEDAPTILGMHYSQNVVNMVMGY